MLHSQFLVNKGQIRNLAKLSKDLRAKFGEFGPKAGSALKFEHWRLG
jgi:hypothetical protein